MNIKHEVAIRALFAALKSASQEERASLYDSLTVLISDLDVFFDERASNAHYMKEKTGLFIEACKVVAGLADPPVSVEQSISYAYDNLLKVRSLAQWK